jgi:acetyltransferase
VTKPDLETEKLINSSEALSEYEAKKVLRGHGIPITKEILAASADSAVKAARKIGYPVALKIQSAQIAHKTEAGGIKLNVTSDAEVRAGFKEVMANAKKYMPDAKIQGVLVQEMLKDGVEVIIGTTKDPVFGHVIMFGLGGIFVEALKDVSFRITPLSRVDAEEMVAEIKGYSVLQGLRGKPPVDIDALVDVILKVSRLVTDHKNVIKELDINPLVINASGAKVADALIIKK